MGLEFISFTTLTNNSGAGTIVPIVDYNHQYNNYPSNIMILISPVYNTY